MNYTEAKTIIERGLVMNQECLNAKRFLVVCDELTELRKWEIETCSYCNGTGISHTPIDGMTEEEVMKERADLRNEQLAFAEGLIL